MSDLSDPWSVYARLQADLARRHCVDNRSWGLESGLNGILKSVAGSQPQTYEEIDRTIASECRRERYRTGLHLLYSSPEKPTHPEAALHCHYELRAIKTHLGQRDWALLRAVADGQSYKELAAATGLAPGHLRVRVLRLRRQVGDLIAA